MAKPKGSQRIKLRTLALAFVTALLLSCILGSTPPVSAFPVNIPINSISYGSLGSFNVIKANLTNNYILSLDLVVFAIWKDTGGQTVAIGTGGLTLASGATGTTFAPLTDELPRGSYIVNVFVVTTNNYPVSSPAYLFVVV